MQQSFTSNEVIALTGITARQLQWWDERGIVVPSRDGHRRIYSLDDLAEVAVICDLRRRGFSLQKIRRVVRFLQRELGKRLVETVTAASEYHLLTDGRHIYLEDSARAVVDLLKNARQPMLSVCLSDTIQRILHPLERKRPARPSEGRQAKLAANAAASQQDSSVRQRNIRGRKAS
jgi:DNA-binding transcriptional MerR regulator